MSLSDLASIGNFVSGFAVLISLIYLALQVRQAERNQQAMMQQARAARSMDANLRMADAQLAEIYDRVSSGRSDVSQVEFLQFGFIFRALFQNFEDAYLQRKSNSLEEEVFLGVASQLSAVLSRPGSRVLWRRTRDSFSPSFRDFVDATLRDNPVRRLRDPLEAWKVDLAAENAPAET